jgi:hypothetical protein
MIALSFIARLRHGGWAARIVLAGVLAASFCPSAFALITGGEGNTPIRDPGWPNGADAIFNHAGRIAWWEGPPFGGGQWHAECRGDAKTLSAVLAEFAKLDVKNKRLVVHDGVGRSFWLNPNREPDKAQAAKVDWVFEVWQKANWERLRKLPADLNPTDAGDAERGPPAQIDVYTGGNIRWSDVTIPKGLKVIDHRLEAHGFTLADGIVLEGKIIDAATKRPIAARVRLERVEPQSKGGYRYIKAAVAAADAKGHWMIKNAPTGWHRVVVAADGYAPRVVGYGQFDDQPRWSSFDCRLSRLSTVSGRVTDESGRPLGDVEVRIGDLTSNDGGRYETPQTDAVKTGADGRFRAEKLPVGKATIWVRKPGYCRAGLGLAITLPANDVAISMTKAAQLRVIVDFSGTTRPDAYIVQIEPEGGSKIGSWGGSGNLDGLNQISFTDVPPGRYIVHGQPNPSNASQKTEQITVDLKGGETIEAKLYAK